MRLGRGLAVAGRRRRALAFFPFGHRLVFSYSKTSKPSPPEVGVAMAASQSGSPRRILQHHSRPAIPVAEASPCAEPPARRQAIEVRNPRFNEQQALPANGPGIRNARRTRKEEIH